MIPSGFLPIVDPTVCGEMSLAQVIEEILEADSRHFLLRHKSASLNDYRRLVEEIQSLKQAMDFDVILHHHWILATEFDCAGVHLTSGANAIAAARQILKPEQWLGTSVHSLDEAMQAEDEGADYVILGAVFPTPKENPNHPVIGLETLENTCRILTIPVFAVGGIDAMNLQQIKEAGAYGFCALRAIYENGEIEHNISKMQFIWDDLN